MHKRERQKETDKQTEKGSPQNQARIAFTSIFQSPLLCLNLSEFDGSCKYILAASLKDRLNNVVVSDPIKHK